LTQLKTLLGSDLRSHAGSLTCSICDQIFIKPLHWPKATNLREGTTHAVDFGAGGISGIGPLTTRSVDGRGVRVIVIGEKGRGDAEFYSVRGMRDEPWVKKCAPSLVKTRLALRDDMCFNFLTFLGQ
jgi:fatty acid synthase subunit alpha